MASRRYANYVLGVLFLAYVFNFIDRQFLASTVLFFVLNLIGMGLGPQAIGILNDRHRALPGADG